MTGEQLGNATRAESADATRQGRNETHVIGRVDIGSAVGKSEHDVSVAVLSSNGDWRDAILCTVRVRCDECGGASVHVVHVA